MFKKILIASWGGISALRAFAPSREPKFLLFSREAAKTRRVQGIDGPGSNIVACAADGVMLDGGVKTLMTVAVMAMLAACDMDSRANEPFAVGSWTMIDQSVQAARRCLVASARADPLDGRQALLLIPSSSSAQAKACVTQWLRKNAPTAELTLTRRAEIGLK
jgi:hypothetical protein